MALLFPKNQIPRSEHLQHTSAGGLLRCPVGWGISALCIKPIHQLQAGKERQSLTHPKQNKEGKRFSPCKLLSSCWNGFEWGVRGGGGSPELWGLSRVRQSSWNAVSACPRHSEGSLDQGQLLTCSVTAGDAKSMSGSTSHLEKATCAFSQLPWDVPALPPTPHSDRGSRASQALAGTHEQRDAPSSPGPMSNCSYSPYGVRWLMMGRHNPCLPISWGETGPWE